MARKLIYICCLAICFTLSVTSLSLSSKEKNRIELLLDNLASSPSPSNSGLIRREVWSLWLEGYIVRTNKSKIDEALDWLRNNNHGDLIKNTVSIDYARGEDNAAEKMKQDLRTQGQSFTDKTGVHPQTLKAFVREQTESGKNLPLDLLGAHIGQKTIIKEV